MTFWIRASTHNHSPSAGWLCHIILRHIRNTTTWVDSEGKAFSFIIKPHCRKNNKRSLMGAKTSVSRRARCFRAQEHLYPLRTGAEKLSQIARTSHGERIMLRKTTRSKTRTPKGNPCAVDAFTTDPSPINC